MQDGGMYGVPAEWCVVIMLFWLILAFIIFGFEIQDDFFVISLISFFSFGTVLLVGHFGWMVLVIPSLLIILIAILCLIGHIAD
jgi:hypothetical protein